MAEVPRAQVEEPRFGVSIQPAADPVDRTIIARAPQITADPYMNAWSEIARDFAAGYGALKKAQVEADIPVGEQYYLDSGVDGLFEAGKDDQAAMANLVRNGELAEEHSIGTRIGFERASGRSAAYRERDKIQSTLTEMISGARELDPQTGLPKLATAQDIDAAIAKIRAESYTKYNQDPNFAWFKNSPYAAEEYNKLMRTYVPDMASAFKEKARENLTEHRRVLIMDELVNKAATLGTKAEITMDEFNNLNDFVFNNVIIGGIPNPQQFMAQAFQVAGLKMLNDNPRANQVGLMEQFIDRVHAYKDPKTGTKIQGLFWEKTKDALRTEARQRESQMGVDRRKMIDAGYNDQFAKGSDPNSFVAQASKILVESQVPGASKEMALANLGRLRDAMIDAALKSADPAAGAYVPDIFSKVYTDFAERISGSIQTDRYMDMAYKDQALTFAVAGRYDKAQEVLGQIGDIDTRITTASKIRGMQDNKIDEYYKDPIFRSAEAAFKKTKEFSMVGLEIKDTTRLPRSSIFNKTSKAIEEQTFFDDQTRLREAIESIVIQKDLSESEKRDKIRELPKTFTEPRLQRQREVANKFVSFEKNLAERESKFVSATDLIQDAYDRNLIDVDSYNQLLKAEETLMQRVFKTEDTIKAAARSELYRLVNEKNPNPNAIKFGQRVSIPTTTGTVDRTELNSSAVAEIEAVTDLVSKRMATAYSEGKFDQFEKVFGIKLERRPVILRDAAGYKVMADAVKATANKVIALRLAGQEIPEL